MALDSVRHQEQNSVFVLSASKYFSEKFDFSNSVFVLSASKYFSEKFDFSRVTLTYSILKSKFLKSTKFATGRFLLVAAHIAKGSA